MPAAAGTFVFEVVTALSVLALLTVSPYVQRMEDVVQKRTWRLKALVALLFGAMGLAGCTTTATTPDKAGSSGARAEIDDGVGSTLSRLSRELVAKADGVLVFPRVIAAGRGVGGQYGRGALRVKGQRAGYYSLASLSIGFQAGAQSKAMIILFMTRAAGDPGRAFHRPAVAV